MDNEFDRMDSNEVTANKLDRMLHDNDEILEDSLEAIWIKLHTIKCGADMLQMSLYNNGLGDSNMHNRCFDVDCTITAMRQTVDTLKYMLSNYEDNMKEFRMQVDAMNTTGRIA